MYRSRRRSHLFHHLFHHPWLNKIRLTEFNRDFPEHSESIMYIRFVNFTAIVMKIRCNICNNVSNHSWNCNLRNEKWIIWIWNTFWFWIHNVGTAIKTTHINVMEFWTKRTFGNFVLDVVQWFGNKFWAWHNDILIFKRVEENWGWKIERRETGANHLRQKYSKYLRMDKELANRIRFVGG